MKTPFIYGRLARGSEFTNRKAEIEHLEQNFSSGINTILISPRRWGKSSLVAHAATITARKNSKVRFCQLDLHNVKSEEEFYTLLAKEVLKAASTKWEEIMSTAKEIFKKVVPVLSFSPGAQEDFSLSINWKDARKDADEILNAAEVIAEARNIRFVICIDEFQNIAELEGGLALQKKMRSHWQRHEYVSYCLYGSKRHMMLEVFTNASMPFYKFGDLILLEKIKVKDWEKFIVKRFRDTDKQISPKLAADIAKRVACHPYYVQQLAQQTWLRAKKTATEEDVETAHTALVQQLSLLFQNITDSLTKNQVEFLRALTDGVTQFSSKKTLEGYGLGTSANIKRIKDALSGKEIIDTVGERIEMTDPIYEEWLKTYYF